MNITLVTSFFDINRENNEIKELSRSNQKYVEYFRTWARIKNKLIIYTEPKMVDILYNVRKEFGRENETEIIVIDDIYSILPKIYLKMKEIENDEAFLKFRYYSRAMSNQADYCYLVLLQYWIINDVVERGMIDEQLAWIDLGFNHGKEYYTNPEEFDFKLDYSFDDKINCFTLYDPVEISAIDSLQFQKDCFMGGFMSLPKEKAKIFWEHILEAELSLLMLGCMDDDQQLLLMAYKKYKEEFSIHICNWFEPLRICGANHLSFRKKIEKKTSFRSNVSDRLRILIKGKNPEFYKKSKERADSMY